jgi:hypothetical protein
LPTRAGVSHPDQLLFAHQVVGYRLDQASRQDGGVNTMLRRVLAVAGTLMPRSSISDSLDV